MQRVKGIIRNSELEMDFHRNEYIFSNRRNEVIKLQLIKQKDVWCNSALERAVTCINYVRVVYQFLYFDIDLKIVCTHYRGFKDEILPLLSNLAVLS